MDTGILLNFGGVGGGKGNDEKKHFHLAILLGIEREYWSMGLMKAGSLSFALGAPGTCFKPMNPGQPWWSA